MFSRNIMTMNDIKEEWSVWTAFVRFQDGVGGKERPVIVLDDKIILCICMGVTSKQKSHHLGYKLKEWRHAGLIKESWVRFEYLRIGPGDFRNWLGRLHDDDILGIQEWLNDLAYDHKKYGLS